MKKFFRFSIAVALTIALAFALFLITLSAPGVLAGAVCPDMGLNSSLTACLVNPSPLQSLQGQVSESKPPKHPGLPVNPPVGPKPMVGWNS